jgi:hypothetical protein
MPEKTTRSRAERAFCLSDADRQRQIVRVFCHYCRKERRYLPADLVTIFGDLSAYKVAEKMRCESCGRSDYIAAECKSYYGADLEQLRVRRLVGIKTVQVPIWTEGDL